MKKLKMTLVKVKIPKQEILPMLHRFHIFTFIGEDRISHKSDMLDQEITQKILLIKTVLVSVTSSTSNADCKSPKRIKCFDPIPIAIEIDNKIC